MRHASHDAGALDPSRASLTGPLLLWLAPQLIALVIAASRVALWARYPQPGELMGLRLILCAQFGFASLLFPLLLRDRRSIVVVIASAWPMGIIAGSLSATPIDITLRSQFLVTGFLIALACWVSNLRGKPVTTIAVSLTSLWTIGGPLLVYLRNEFGDTSQPIRFWLAGPLWSIQHQLSGDSKLFPSVIGFVAIACMGIICGVLRRRTGSTIRQHRTVSASN